MPIAQTRPEKRIHLVDAVERVVELAGQCTIIERYGEIQRMSCHMNDSAQPRSIRHIGCKLHIAPTVQHGVARLAGIGESHRFVRDFVLRAERFEVARERRAFDHRHTQRVIGSRLVKRVIGHFGSGSEHHVQGSKAVAREGERLSTLLRRHQADGNIGITRTQQVSQGLIGSRTRAFHRNELVRPSRILRQTFEILVGVPHKRPRLVCRRHRLLLHVRDANDASRIGRRFVGVRPCRIENGRKSAENQQQKKGRERKHGKNGPPRAAFRSRFLFLPQSPARFPS